MPTVFMAYTNGLSYMRSVCEECANIPPDKLESVLVKQPLIKSEDTEIIVLAQLLYDDFDLLRNGIYKDDETAYNKLLDTYDELKNIYGEEFIDLIITKDTDSIITSIRSLLEFIMNDVYKTNELKVSFYDSSIDEGTINTNYPNLIYSAIQLGFDIKEHECDLYHRKIWIIKKEENENGDGN